VTVPEEPLDEGMGPTEDDLNAAGLEADVEAEAESENGEAD
jgi:hypothetical protein